MLILYIVKLKLSLLTIFAILVTIGLSIRSKVPLAYQKQDPIDPDNIQLNQDPNNPIAYFNNQPLKAPSSIDSDQVLGVNTDTSAVKRIEVDLTNQTLTAYENDVPVYRYIISSGKWDRTPVGDYKIWTKVRSQKMSGGSKEDGTYYYLPNVPYILFFYNDKVAKKTGYSIHGTYWHNNFGVPMSHGCINMKTEEVANIYNWADLNTTIHIFGKFETTLPSATISKYSDLLSYSWLR